MDIVVAIVVIVSLLVGFLVGYLLRRKSESEKSSKIEQMSAEILTLTSEAAALRSAKQMLTAQIEDERVRSAQELEQQRTQWREDFNRELEIVSSQLKNETNRTNRESITEIMRPYQQQLEELKSRAARIEPPLRRISRLLLKRVENLVARRTVLPAH